MSTQRQQQDLLKHRSTQYKEHTGSLGISEGQVTNDSEHHSFSSSSPSLQNYERIASTWDPLRSLTHRSKKIWKLRSLKYSQIQPHHQVLLYQPIKCQTTDVIQTTNLLTNPSTYTSSTKLGDHRPSCYSPLITSQSVPAQSSCRLEDSSVDSDGMHTPLVSPFTESVALTSSSRFCSGLSKLGNFDLSQKMEYTSSLPLDMQSPNIPIPSILPSSTLFGQEMSLYRLDDNTKSAKDSGFGKASLHQIAAKSSMHQFARQLQQSCNDHRETRPINSVMADNKECIELARQTNKAIAGMFTCTTCWPDIKSTTQILTSYRPSC